MTVAVVTGAFGTLGRAVIADLNARGYTVAALDLVEASDGAPAALAFGGVDLGDEGAVTNAYARIADTLGSIDGVVNVAGGFVWEPVVGAATANWDRMYALNLKTAVTSIQAALPHFGDRGGAIVNIGAAGALHPALGMAPYAASKAGVHALTQSLAEELRPRAIRVNAVLPTILDTLANRADMPDADTAAWVKPDAAARVIAFLLSAESASISGASIPLSLAG